MLEAGRSISSTSTYSNSRLHVTTWTSQPKALEVDDTAMVKARAHGIQEFLWAQTPSIQDDPRAGRKLRAC